MRVARQSWQDATTNFQFQRFHNFKPGWSTGHHEQSKYQDVVVVYQRDTMVSK